MKERERCLTFEERATWGECEVCGAKDGEWCDMDKGFPLGVTLCGERPKNGAHLARLGESPRRVKEVAIG